MKPRLLLKLLLVASAIAGLMTLVGWSRSHWRGEELQCVVARAPAGPRAIEAWTAAHGGGDVVVLYYEGTSNLATPGWRYGHVASGSVRNMLPVYVRGIAGYGIGTELPKADISRYVAITLPYWLIFLVPATPWLIVAWRWRPNRAARRVAAGLCPTCAYDLRASPGRCPECGAVAPGTPA